MVDADKREKVIRGLTVCGDDIYKCIDCPYHPEYNGNTNCSNHLCADALALLKKQDERIQFFEKWIAYLEGGDPYEGAGVLNHDKT